MNVFEALRKRYPAPAWAFMEEVRNATGFGSVTRTCDALAMSLFPSRGLHLHGFEVKVSRGDWIKELKDPAKAEEIARFCHFWWLAVDDEKIVRDGELPATWGLLAMKGEELRAVKQPTLNAEAQPPTHRFLGAVLRKFAASDTDGARIDRARKEGRDEGERDGYDRGLKNAEGARYQKLYEDLQVSVDAFEKQSGIALGRWSIGNVGAIVKLLRDWDSPIRSFQQLARQADEIAKVCAKGAEEAKHLLPQVQDAAS